MANIKFTNFARSKVATGIGAGDTTLAITGGTGALFPALTGAEYFYLTLENSSLVREIVKVTARSTDTLTIVRAQDGTTAVAWVAGDVVSLRFNAAAISEAVTGTLLAANNLSDVSNAAIARANLGAQAAGSYAASGANADITSLTALAAGGLPDNSVLTADIANGNVTPAKLSQPFTSGTAVATTSGTSIDFTGIPSWAKRITVVLNGVSTNGTSLIQIQIGSGSIQTTGYLSTRIGNATGGVFYGTLTSGFFVGGAGAATLAYGVLVINIVSGNTYVAAGNMYEGTNIGSTNAGGVTLSGTLDRIRLTTFNGTDTFDAGSINILYE